MTTPPEITPTPVSDVTSDDRIWVILCMLFTPLFPIITLFMEEKKKRSYIKYHYIPALLLGVVEMVVISIISVIPVVRYVGGLLWVVNIYYAIKANSGINFDIPYITEFSKKQGWS